MNNLDTTQPAPAPAQVLEYTTPIQKPHGAPAWIMPVLTVGSTAIAALLWLLGRASMLEAVSFVTGALCVWLTVRESVWNFPLGLLNVATFAVVFFRTGLYADASLQIVYVVLTLVGWYLWLFGGREHTALRVSRVTEAEAIAVAAAGVVMMAVFWGLVTFAAGVSPFFDALTTSLSLCAQWLLNRKRLENWFFWIAADVVYVPLYAFKGLYLTSILYAVFLAMCVIGVRQWHATWKLQQRAAEAA